MKRFGFFVFIWVAAANLVANLGTLWQMTYITGYKLDNSEILVSIGFGGMAGAIAAILLAPLVEQRS